MFKPLEDSYLQSKAFSRDTEVQQDVDSDVNWIYQCEVTGGSESSLRGVLGSSQRTVGGEWLVGKTGYGKYGQASHAWL